MPTKYSIKDLERLSGIKAHTLRIWEQRYELLSPERTSTNIRYYNSHDLKKILNVSLLNNNGHKISNIARLSNDTLVVEAEKLLQSYAKESDQIENLLLALLEWNESKFEETVNNCIEHFGLENTVEKILFPFLKQLGNMWQVGMVNPAQEHFITNLIRQKIIVEIDKIKTKSNLPNKKHLFFLPNKEMHEMGLLYTHFLCKKKGYPCFYLGQSVPIDDVLSVLELLKPDYLVTILTSPTEDIDVADLLKLYDEKLKDVKVLISGRMIFSTENPIKMPSSKFQVFNDFEHFKMLI